MKATETALPGVWVFEPEVFADERGYFTELWRDVRYAGVGVPGTFVQDNLSVSRRGVLRGLHYQWPAAQGKLVSVLEGEVFDVVVDVRKGSPTFGRWVSEHLSATNHRQLWVPGGFAHGFLVLSDRALFHYKVTSAYEREDEVTLRWNDPALAINWPVQTPVLSHRDAAAPGLADLPEARLPTWSQDRVPT